jgi:hypothetical protein
MSLEGPGSLGCVGCTRPTGARFDFPTPEGGVGNYPSALIKNVRAIRTPGSSVTGYGARVDFVLSPRHVTCRKTAHDTEIACMVHNPDGTALSGPKRRRKRGR